MRALLPLWIGCAFSALASSPSAYAPFDPSPNKFISKIFAGGQTWRVQVLTPQIETAQFLLSHDGVIGLKTAMVMFDDTQVQGVMYGLTGTRGEQKVPEFLRVEWTPNGGTYRWCMILKPSAVKQGQPFQGYAFSSLSDANTYAASGQPGHTPRCTLTLVK